MSKFKRMHLVVLDSVGIGAAPDANNFVNAGVPDGASDTSVSYTHLDVYKRQELI